MNRIAVALCLLLPLAAYAAPHTDNPREPRDGTVALEMSRSWHRGFDEDDFIFGAVRTVVPGPEGRLYVLDTQLAQVFVFATDGELLGTLSREGDGPGESRRPEDLVVFEDGSLGIAQYINGRIVHIAADGTPLGTLMPPGTQDDGGGMSSIRRVRCRGGSLVINGARVSPDGEGGMIRTQYLVRCDDAGRPLVEYLSRSTSSNLMRDGWIEKNNYFPSHERWDIDAQGRVAAACDRNEYRITVFAPDGSVVRTFGRDYEPWRRTEEEKQAIRDGLVVLQDDRRLEVEVEVEEAAPAVAQLRCGPDGETWVLPTRGTHEQPDGVMMTWDVFDAEGVFVRQAAVACAGDPREDRLFFLEPGRAALVRGAAQARRNAFGGSRVESSGDVLEHDLQLLTW